MHMHASLMRRRSEQGDADARHDVAKPGTRTADLCVNTSSLGIPCCPSRTICGMAKQGGRRRTAVGHLAAASASAARARALRRTPVSEFILHSPGCSASQWQEVRRLIAQCLDLRSPSSGFSSFLCPLLPSSLRAVKLRCFSLRSSVMP
jgi:hypothetical protein